jgi:hypothetical protein
MAVSDWSATASSNVTLGGININTGMSPANVDNAIRELMAEIKAYVTGDINNLATQQPISVYTPNSGTTGGIRLRANATSGAAILQFVDSTGASQFGYLQVTSDGTLKWGTIELGYRDLPLVTKSAAFTFADAERGGRIRYTGAAAAATINPNSTTAITDGAVYYIRNKGTGALTVTRGSGVSLYKNGSTTSADAVLAVGAVASLVRDGTDDWTITGSGIS